MHPRCPSAPTPQVPLHRGLAGYVSLTGDRINLHGAYADSRFDPTTDHLSGQRTKALLCVPIPGPPGGAALGAVQARNKAGGGTCCSLATHSHPPHRLCEQR